MPRLLIENLTRLVASIALLVLALPALAHPDAGHGSFDHGVFFTGFLHPLTGLDHLLAMLAVGIWAAQSQGKARWALVLSFPVMMIVGALIGLFGVQIAGVELTIALSVAVLGLLIAFAITLPTAVSAALVAFFAIFHGYAHATELPAGSSILAYAAGFMLATALLHLIGLSFALLRLSKFDFMLRRFSGMGIATSGGFFLFGLA